MKVLLDCDGVLLDWESSFREWVTGKLRRPIAAHPSDWCLSKWLGTTTDEAAALVDEFNHGEFFGNLSPVHGAAWAIGGLAEAGIEMHVITSCSTAPGVTERRRRNLAARFGDVFASVTCLDLGQSKVKALVDHEPGAIWVEDNYIHALTGLALGHRTFVMRYPHNRSYEASHRISESQRALTWCDDWAGIMLHIFDESETPVRNALYASAFSL